MLSAGIDIGAENIKLAIIKDDRLLAHITVPSGWDTKASIQQAFDEVTGETGLDRKEFKLLGATGMGRETIESATVYNTDSTCSARGITWLIPSARTVIDIGAEQSQVFSCDAAGKVQEFTRNENCAAGAGAFIEETATALELGIADIGDLSLTSKKDISLNSTCAIFAESEVISLINEGIDKTDIARAICNAIAGKAVSLLKSINVQKDVIFIGGVARNTGVVDSLRKSLNMDILIPEEPEIVTAVGAALLAQQAIKDK
ncbi:acyl-CoA dehydratase activase [Chloroflexota bacterium]